MNEKTEDSAEGLLEAWRQRIAAFRIRPDQLSYIDHGKIVAGGGFGEVKKAVYTGRTRKQSSVASPTTSNPKTHGITVAVKTLQIHMKIDGERIEKRFMREAYVWSQLKNDHIIEFLGFYFSSSEGKTEALLVCPWMENGESVRYVKQQHLPPGERLQLLLDAAKGLQYLHSRVPPICHGDIKGSNVLVKNDGRAAICDFGLAQVLDEEFERLASQTTHRGTIRWTSPERLEDNGPLAPSSDVWSWAWLIWEFMTEKIPFHFVSHASAVIFHIVTLKFPAYDQEAAISAIPTLSKLMQLCWQKEPESRLSMEECIERLEQILEGFEPPEDVGKDQNLFVRTSPLFQPTATPSFPPGPPPPEEFNSLTKSGGVFDPPTVIIPPSPPGGRVPPAYPGPMIPSGSDKSRKDLPPIPPIPRQDDGTIILTTFDSSHEQRTDLEPSWEPKPQPAHVPENPPSAFNFKGLGSFKLSKTSSSESSNKVTAIGLKKLTQRLLPSFKRKPQQSDAHHDGEWDWDIIPGPSQSSWQPPPNNTAGNHDPSNQVNRDGADLRPQIDYIMRTLQRLEDSQKQHSRTQEDITNYLRQMGGWFSGAPVFGSPYFSSRPQPIVIGGQPIVTVQPTQPIYPGQPIQPGFAGQPTQPIVTGQPIQPIFTGQPIQPIFTGQPTQPIVIGQPIRVVQPPGMAVPQIPAFIPPSRIASPAFTAGHPQTGSPGQSPASIAYELARSLRSPSPSPVSPPSPVVTPHLVPTAGGPRDYVTVSLELSPPLIEGPSLSIRDSLASSSTHLTRSDGTREVELELLYLPAIRQFKQSEFDLQYENGFEGGDQAQMGVILETGRAIAIKPVTFTPENGARASKRGLMPQLNKWLKLWGSLEHENVTKVLGSAFVNEAPAVITEWCRGGNVAQYLEKSPQADRRSLRTHIDKKSNVLIDDERVKLADIGILRFLETQHVGAEMHGRTGDARWTAPEVLEGRGHRLRSDIYSFGCLALFILRNELPYAALRNDVAVSKAIYRGDLPVSREVASGLHPTWKLCWAQDPQRRPRMSTILESVREIPVLVGKQHANGIVMDDSWNLGELPP
ncbi:hypothetical protein FRC00_013762 [Tulasnella sp. 408]|nr:hypothetical protein FRC00_013762 [Tulasnella sp. 408]